ncbi:MAG: hypothetical protein KTR32_40710 [Granulosicoccus sp.]|nr:hypothetical protein [Granulosicoccus sp.]
MRERMTVALSNQKKTLTLSCLIGFIFLLSSCGTKGIEIADAYDTSRFTPEQMAILYVADSLSVWELDGNDTNFTYLGHSGQAIRMGPGSHVAVVHFRGYGGETTARKSFNLPRPGDYFISHTLVKKDGNSYIKLHVHECGSEEEDELRQAHNKRSYTRYKNGCPENK